MMCLNPMLLERHGYDAMLVPCGICRWCRVMRSQMWAQRMMNEREYWDKSVFVTLTYNNEKIPSDYQLKKDDLQKFIKRIRKAIEPDKIKYFACGEYGEQFERPHYHMVIFGMGTEDYGLIESEWRLGFVYVGEVTEKSCKYVSKYITKAPLGRSRKDAMEQNREPAFQCCSRGLGLRWIMERAETVGARGIRKYGKATCLPRYYVKWLKSNALLSDSVIEDARIEGMQKSNDLHRRLRSAGVSVAEYLATKAEEIKTLDSLHAGKDKDLQ